MSNYYYSQRHRSRSSGDVAGQHTTTQEVREQEQEEDRRYETRLPTSTRRYHPLSETRESRAVRRQGRRDVVIYEGEVQRLPPLTSRRSQVQTQAPEPSIPRSGTRSFHPLFFVGLAMLVMLVGWIGLSSVLHWWQIKQDDLRYGRPRTYQCDAVVGHHHDSAEQPSHFIALNLNGHVLVIELPAGDASKAEIYSGPVLLGEGETLTPVTLSFADVTGDGKLDLLVHLGSSRIVFVNDGNRFRPQQPGDHLSA
jgi:hypothetical protein